MKKRAIISIVLSAFLLMGNVVSYGATTQEKISDAKAKQQENQTSLQQTQEKIEELEGKKGESERKRKRKKKFKILLLSIY